MILLLMPSIALANYTTKELDDLEHTIISEQETLPFPFVLIARNDDLTKLILGVLQEHYDAAVEYAKQYDGKVIVEVISEAHEPKTEKPDVPPTGGGMYVYPLVLTGGCSILLFILSCWRKSRKNDR